MQGSDQQAPEQVAAAKKKKSGSKGKKKTFYLLPTVEAATAQLPWKVAATQRLGRHAVASIDLPAGTLILKEEPVAKVLLEASAPLCHSCLRPNQTSQASTGYTKLCSSCHNIATRDTQLEAVHCAVPAIAERFDVAATLLHLLVELACNPQEAAVEQLSPEGTTVPSGAEAALRCGIQDAELLQSHWDLYRPEWRKVVAAACQELDKQLPASSEGGRSQQQLPSTEGCVRARRSIKELAAIINSNSHGIGAALGETGMDCALGIFPALSMLNHSCRPNCNFVSQGPTMHVRTIAPVKAGEELTVAYINLYDPRGTRQAQLQASKFFLCACPRCKEPLAQSTDLFLEAAQCTADGCSTGLLVRLPGSGGQEHSHGHRHGPPDHSNVHEHHHGPGEACSHCPADPAQWQCLACKCTVPGSRVDGLGPADLVRGVETQLATGLHIARSRQYKAARQVLEGAMKVAEAALHPWHVLIFDARIPLINCCRATDDSVAALQHCTKLIAAAEGLVGQLPTHELARWYTLLADLQSQRAEQARSGLRAHAARQAAEARAKAASIRRVCIGTS